MKRYDPNGVVDRIREQLEEILHTERDEIERRLRIDGNLLGRRHADCHFDIRGQAAENFPHQGTLAIGEQGSLSPVQRRDRLINVAPLT